MRKILLTLFAVLFAVPAFAVEVYNNGENSVGIYGAVLGYMGYGLSATGETNGSVPVLGSSNTPSSLNHNMMYGLQNNTRVGTNIKIGNFTAQFELGANEQTLRSSATNTIGFRQAWGAYTFANGSKLLFGKTSTPTSMGGIISSFYDTDGGLNGYGGMVRSNRRFQVSYTIAGLTLALIEDDISALSTLGADGVTYTDRIAGFRDNAPYTPRAAIAYEFKNDSLLAKIAATYTAVNGSYTDAVGATKWTNLHAFGVVLGVRPTFGNMWVGFHARYGMNEDLYGEGKTVANNGKYSHDSFSLSFPTLGTVSRTINNDGSFNNTHRAGAALEFGINVTENFAAVIGGGYQATIQEIGDTINITGIGAVGVTDPSYLVHSYAIFVQTPYKFNQNFALVPEIAWFSTSGKASANVNGMAGAVNGKAETSASQSGLLVGVQFKATF